jgi:hypothetical protein
MPFLDETGLKRVWSKVKSLVSNASSAEQNRAVKAENNIQALIVSSNELGGTATKAYTQYERFTLNGNQLCMALKSIAKGETLKKGYNYIVEPVAQALYEAAWNVESYLLKPGDTIKFTYSHTLMIYTWYNSLYTPSSIPKILPGDVTGTIHVTVDGTDGTITANSDRKTFTNNMSQSYILICGIGNAH